MIRDFPKSPATEEALFLMMKSYDALKLPELRDDAQRVLRTNFPKSAYLTADAPTDRKAAWWKLW